MIAQRIYNQTFDSTGISTERMQRSLGSYLRVTSSQGAEDIPPNFRQYSDQHRNTTRDTATNEKKKAQKIYSRFADCTGTNEGKGSNRWGEDGNQGAYSIWRGRECVALKKDYARGNCWGEM